MTNPILPGETNLPPSLAPVSDGGPPFTAGWYAFARSLWIRTGGRPGPDHQTTLSLQGKPLAGYTYAFSVPISIYLPRNFEGASGFCFTTATADAVFSVARLNPISGAVSLGTLTIPAASNYGVIGASAPVRLDAGDAIAITTPNPQDATLADLSISLLARKI